MTFNENLSEADARHILEVLVPTAGYRIDHTTLSRWRDGHNKAFIEQVGIPGCSCEYIATMRVWQSRINQYDPQIRAIAYPVVEKVLEKVKEVKTRKKVAK